MSIRNESQLKEIADDIWVYRDNTPEAIIKAYSLMNDIIDTLYTELNNIEVGGGGGDGTDGSARLMAYIGMMT